VQRLQALTPSDITEAATERAETEELSAAPEETSRIVEQFATLAQSVAGNGLDVFLWFSL
jgi:hypothetical protein